MNTINLPFADIEKTPSKAIIEEPSIHLSIHRNTGCIEYNIKSVLKNSLNKQMK